MSLIALARTISDAADIFKPASITTATPGTFSVDPSGSKQMTFDMPAGGQQVFEAKEDAVSKHQECVLMWEEGSQVSQTHHMRCMSC